MDNKIYFNSLTGLRAIAAYLVFFHHYNPIPTNNENLKPIFNFFAEFHIGVTIFFVLSGFLITLRYLNLENFNLFQYIINRFARIYPLYFILTTITFFFQLISNGPHLILKILALFVLNITFLRGFFDDFKFSGVSQGWSLTVEETFYLLAPVVFLILNKNKSVFFKTTFLILIPFTILSIGLLLVAFFSRIKINIWGLFETFEFMFNYTFFGRCFEFFAGIALAMYYLKYKSKPKLNYLTYFGLANIILCVIVLSIIKGDFDFGIRTPLGKFINSFALPLMGIVPLIIGLIHEETLFRNLLSNKAGVLLGKSSYAFYLIHLGIIPNLLANTTQNIYLLFILLNIISILIFINIEDPLNILFKNKLRSFL